jgi:hypothetical protein
VHRGQSDADFLLSMECSTPSILGPRSLHDVADLVPPLFPACSCVSEPVPLQARVTELAKKQNSLSQKCRDLERQIHTHSENERKLASHTKGQVPIVSSQAQASSEWPKQPVLCTSLRCRP